MPQEVALFENFPDPLICEVVRPEYDDPHLPEFGLRALHTKSDKPIGHEWMQVLVRQTAVRDELNKYGFLEVDIAMPEYLEGLETNDYPLAYFDPEIQYADFGSMLGWQRPRTQNEHWTGWKKSGDSGNSCSH